MCSSFSAFALFYLIFENMSTNVRKFCFHVIFDTCDVVCNWSISLLLPIVLDNLFEHKGFQILQDQFGFVQALQNPIELKSGTLLSDVQINLPQILHRARNLPLRYYTEIGITFSNKLLGQFFHKQFLRNNLCPSWHWHT